MNDGDPASRIPALSPVDWERETSLCAPFVRLLPISGASICVLHGDVGHSTVCASNVLAARLDAMQFELAEGPHWAVARNRSPTLSPDLGAESHPEWPVFGSGIALLDVRALFAFPILIGSVMVGVVDLYRRTPGPLGRVATARALSLARQVAGPAVREALRTASIEHGDEHPRAPALRREVHQAVGMVFVQLEVTTAEALALLRAHAFATGRTLEALARDVVDRRIDFRTLSG